MTRTVPTPHLFIPDPEMPPDINGVRWCLDCPLPSSHQVHELPDMAEAAAFDARRTGEHDDREEHP